MGYDGGVKITKMICKMMSELSDINNFDSSIKKDIKNNTKGVFILNKIKLDKFKERHTKKNSHLEIEILLKKCLIQGTLK